MRITNDRRRKPRVRLGGAAVVHDGQAPLSCECIDLAIGGVGLRSAVKVKKGRKVMVALSLGDRALTLPAVVARCRGAKGNWILGLRFGRIEPDTTAMLESFIEGALSRDVRMYQAQVFLARTGARSIDEVLGGGAALAGVAASTRTEPAAPTKGPGAEQDGSSPISLDDHGHEAAAERAVTGPWTPAPPAAAAEADKADRAPTGPWAPAPPAPGKTAPPAPATASSRPPPPPTPTATVPALPSPASDTLRTAVTSALDDLQAELDHSSSAPPPDFDDPPRKGGTMIVRNPLLDAPPAQPSSPPSAVATDAALVVGSASFSTDMSGLDLDDGAVSGGRHALGTQIVDPRVLAERSRGGAVRAPPLRIERPQSRAATFKANVADLELDDAPTHMFADPVPESAPEPVVKRRSLPGETQIGPAPQREDAKVFDTPPSPFGSGRARTVVPPSATATLPPPQPPAAPATGHAQYGGATQVATQGPASMPYGPVRGESTQVAMPAHGLPVAPSQATGQQPPSPFGGGEAPPPSPFAPRPAQAAPSSTLRPPAAPAIKPPAPPAIKPKIPSKARPAAPANDARRTFTPEEAATRMRPKPAVQHDGPDPDPEFSAQYSRALADLDLENR